MVANLDGYGNYDIFNCFCCKGNSNCVSCSSSPTTTYPGIIKRGDRERMWIESQSEKVACSLADKLIDKIGAF